MAKKEADRTEAEVLPIDGAEWAEVEDPGQIEIRNIDEGDAIEGYYCGTRDITVDEEPRPVHVFVDGPDAKQWGVWGATSLDRILQGVDPGRLVRVMQTGVKDLRGGRKLKTYGVRVHHSKKIKTPKVAL